MTLNIQSAQTKQFLSLLYYMFRLSLSRRHQAAIFTRKFILSMRDMQHNYGIRNSKLAWAILKFIIKFQYKYGSNVLLNIYPFLN
jgi:hypothetical protein